MILHGRRVSLPWNVNTPLHKRGPSPPPDHRTVAGAAQGRYQTDVLIYSPLKPKRCSRCHTLAGRSSSAFGITRMVGHSRLERLFAMPNNLPSPTGDLTNVRCRLWKRRFLPWSGTPSPNSFQDGPGCAAHGLLSEESRPLSMLPFQLSRASSRIIDAFILVLSRAGPSRNQGAIRLPYPRNLVRRSFVTRQS